MIRGPIVTMVTEISSARKKKPVGFMTLLSFAACEWFLMFLLFVDAALSYFLTKFAQYCELDPPCLLCSRLDNGFGEKKPGFYWSLLCSSHIEEISSLVSCSMHGKFADVHSLCKECLASIAIPNKFNSVSHISAFQKLMLNKEMWCSSDIRTCSCCEKTCRAKSGAERLLDVDPVTFRATRANVKPPLPRAPGSGHFTRRDSLKRLRDKLTGPKTHQSTGRSTDGAGMMHHVGYMKLKIFSDSESEFPFSEDDDDDGGNTDYSSKTCSKSEHKAQCTRRRLYKSPTVGEDSEKQKHQGFEGKPLIVDQPNLIDPRLHMKVDSFSSDAIIEQGLRDHDPEESCNKPSPALTPELISVCDVLQQSDVPEGSLGALAETSRSSDPLPHMPPISVLSELLTFCSVPSLPSDLTIPSQTNDEGTNERGDASMAYHTEACAGTTLDDNHLPTNDVHRVDASTQTDEFLELSGGNAIEPINTSDSAKIEEDRSSNSELSEASQKARIDEGSSSQVPVLALLEKNDSMFKYPDGITVSNVEGEDIVEQLKCQIEHDRNCLNSLYKELEEERNAAASAANEAMAMITRLQEEKAALHMEALHYLRMMEEQAEYHMEALERANDLLVEKDKELQDLEYELEFYRNDFPDKPKVDNAQENSSLNNRVAGHTEMSHTAFSNLKAGKISRINGNCKPVNSSVLNFHDENIYSQNV